MQQCKKFIDMASDFSLQLTKEIITCIHVYVIKKEYLQLFAYVIRALFLFHQHVHLRVQFHPVFEPTYHIVTDRIQKQILNSSLLLLSQTGKICKNENQWNLSFWLFLSWKLLLLFTKTCYMKGLLFLLLNEYRIF